MPPWTHKSCSIIFVGSTIEKWQIRLTPVHVSSGADQGHERSEDRRYRKGAAGWRGPDAEGKGKVEGGGGLGNQYGSGSKPKAKTVIGIFGMVNLLLKIV